MHECFIVCICKKLKVLQVGLRSQGRAVKIAKVTQQLTGPQRTVSEVGGGLCSSLLVHFRRSETCCAWLLAKLVLVRQHASLAGFLYLFGNEVKTKGLTSNLSTKPCFTTESAWWRKFIVRWVNFCKFLRTVTLVLTKMRQWFELWICSV